MCARCGAELSLTIKSESCIIITNTLTVTAEGPKTTGPFERVPIDKKEQWSVAVIEDTMIMQVKKRLEQELAQALAEVDELEKRLESKADYGLGKGDPNIYEWELNFALRQKAEGKVKSIESALQKIENGTYGLCERCKEAIDPERLKILPHTTLCVKCARV